VHSRPAFFSRRFFISHSAPLTKKKIPFTLSDGATFSQLAAVAGVGSTTVIDLLAEAKDVYDLSTIQAGREILFYFDRPGGTLQKVVYDVNSETTFAAEKVATSTWQAATSSIPYEIKIKKVSGTIETSLYEAMLQGGIDERVALALAETFAWQIDFAADIRKGDSFKAIYEERYLDGEYVMPGKILAAEFINDGATFRGFYFEGQESKTGYYDENGNALQKEFLKSPLQYRYISSGFTYSRIDPISGVARPHRGIDYAAPYGTPAVSVGDGTVVQAGWNGQLGLSITVRHNETYTTRYGHFQSLAKGIRVGSKVKQNQVIGYVGDTGWTTGPHLHYEMQKRGKLS